MPRELKQALMVFVASTALVAALGLIAQGVAFINANLGALVAIVFLYLTVFVANRRGEDLVDYGFLTTPRVRSILIAATYIAVVFPIFTAGFVLFYDMACAKGSAIGSVAPPGLCFGYDGWDGAHWPDMDWLPSVEQLAFWKTHGKTTFLELAFVQVVVVALPEELFFRGLIHKLCERALPPKRRVLGGGLGWALIISSALFAVGHLAVTFDARRLAVFFPGLVFGWMRSATGSILAGTIAHAASNLFIHILQKVFF